MEEITIKSVTHCPTCGSECKVEGGTTHHYIPIKKYTEEDMLKLWNTLMVAMTNKNPIFFKDYINSLNKQD